jgi:hypothetical protein
VSCDGVLSFHTFHEPTARPQDVLTQRRRGSVGVPRLDGVQNWRVARDLRLGIGVIQLGVDDGATRLQLERIEVLEQQFLPTRRGQDPVQVHVGIDNGEHVALLMRAPEGRKGLSYADHRRVVHEPALNGGLDGVGLEKRPQVEQLGRPSCRQISDERATMRPDLDEADVVEGPEGLPDGST